jgi:putative FmdB family regulatory protein
VPLYEYRCLDCDRLFEERRPVAEADMPTCPDGHGRVKRLISMFASSRSSTSSDAFDGAPGSAGGGCCGGACGCR